MYFKAILLIIILVYITTIVSLKIRKGTMDRYIILDEYIKDILNASFSRKKEIPKNLYINIDIENFPFDKNLRENDALWNNQQNIMNILEKDIIKLQKPMNNQEIKIEFGVANLESIIEGEKNYNDLLLALINWAEALIFSKDYNKAIFVLKNSIDLGSDISKSYTLLGYIYFLQKNFPELENLYMITMKENFPIYNDLVKNKIRGYLSNYIET